jgi:hypothetical protein
MNKKELSLINKLLKKCHELYTIADEIEHFRFQNEEKEVLKEPKVTKNRGRPKKK